MADSSLDVLVALAESHLERTIYVSMGTQMPNGAKLAKAFSKLVEIARTYYMDDVRKRKMADEKTADAVFLNAVDDYVFKNIVDPIAGIEREPVVPPLQFVSEGRVAIPE